MSTKPLGDRTIPYLNWKLAGNDKWGWTVLLYDTLFEDEGSSMLALCPDDDESMLDWDSPEQAREKAVAALRAMADRIERDEK